MGAIMESTEASWVSMIMDRLQVLEQANDRLEKELDDRYPKKASTPDVEIDVRDPSDKESTYFKVAVFTDRPGLCDLMDFGRALMQYDGTSFTDIVLRSVSWSDVWSETPAPKRNIVYMVGITWRSAAKEVVEMLKAAWGDSIVPMKLPGADSFEPPRRGWVHTSNSVQQTLYHDVWESLMGWGPDAIFIDTGSMEIRTRETCIWSDLTSESPMAGRARLITACGVDEIELYGEADRVCQIMLQDPMFI